MNVLGTGLCGTGERECITSSPMPLRFIASRGTCLRGGHLQIQCSL